MKFIKTLTVLAFATVLCASVALAADKAKTPPGKVAGCCAKATKDGKTCDHGCCVEAAKANKNCEKCKGTNEAKK
jgi:hypothetical protein